MKTPNWFLKKTLVAYILLPLGIVYYVISKFVYICRLFGQKSSKRPVICIGNILAGGVGKSPIVMEVAKKLKAPVVMRGYKKNNHTEQIGDEAKMMKNNNIDVLVGSRKKNILLLNNKRSKTPIVMDDGFQNPIIKKDISVLVFDENIGFGNGFLLPAGPLREPKFAIKRADAIMVIKNNNKTKKSKFIECLKKYNLPLFYATNKTTIPKNNGKIISFAGIGYPQKFFDSILPKSVKEISFPDHYEYKKNDLEKLIHLAESEKAKLITTEKDWVRLPDNAKKHIEFAKLETIIEPAFWGWLKDKTNGIIQ